MFPPTRVPMASTALAPITIVTVFMPAVTAWATAAGITPAALDTRRAPLSAAGRIAYETDDSVRMVRAVTPHL